MAERITGIFKSNNFERVDHAEIYYELINAVDLSKANRLLVLLHEGLGSTSQWKDFPEVLSETLDLPVLVYDRLGYGKSSPVKERNSGYLIDEAECILPRLLKHLEYEGKVILFGHSDGATIALLYAAFYPGKTEKVIAEAPHVFIEDLSVEGVLQTIEAFKTGELKARLEKYHGKQTDSMFWGWANFWSQESSRKWNMLSMLQRIESPVLFIQGDNDNFGTLQQGREIADHVMGEYEELILENCGHIPHFETKEEVLKAIADFIKP
ncbi:MAG: alpha/beta hydrolase [Bacteroidales bacterium]|nr:alpha/beta hydrolase [Bacteroidales bacterium]MCF8456035.1 alpha/beta hydrolase [Bacteroidales bacterium]